MNSKVFSVLKIVAIAMLVFWAASGSSQASDIPGLSCQGYCQMQMGLCTEYCAPYCVGFYYGELCYKAPSGCMGLCISAFYQCMASCSTPSAPCTTHCLM
jgi:hypothetical protein